MFGCIQNLVLAGGVSDLLYRLQTSFFDEVVVRADVQGAEVAVIDAGLLLVEAG